MIFYFIVLKFWSAWLIFFKLIGQWLQLHCIYHSSKMPVGVPHLQTSIVKMFPLSGFSIWLFFFFSEKSTGKGSRPLRQVWRCTGMLHLEMLVFPWNCSPKTLAHCKVPSPMNLLFRSLSFSLQTAVHRGSWNVLVSQIYSSPQNVDFQDRWLLLYCTNS